MGHSNGRITAPVNTDDVSAVLAVNSHDVKTLCMASSINKWAKYKPEVIDTPASITLVQRKLNNFGLSPSAVYASKSAFINAVNAGTFNGGWGYTAVAGVAWGRLDDFVGYYNGATPPFGTLMAGRYVLTTNQSSSLVIPCLEPVDDEGCININEFEKPGADYSKWYFGILLYSSARQFMATATQPIGTSQDWQVNFGWISTSYAGTYKGIPFISSKPFSISGTEPSPVQIIGAGSAGVEIKLVTSAQTYVPYASCMYENSTTLTVSYVITIQNTTSSAVTLTGVALEVAHSNAGTNSQTLVNVGTVTIPANQTYTKNGKAAVATRAFQFCRLKYNGSSNTAWVNFEEPEQDDQG